MAGAAGRGLARDSARTWELFSQVSQVLCASHNANVVTITAGANDFLGGDLNIPAIAGRVVSAINLLLNNGTPAAPVSVTDPVTDEPCPALSNVTIFVSNYHSIPHPVPAIDAQFDQVLRGFDQALRFLLPAVPVQ